MDSRSFRTQCRQFSTSLLIWILLLSVVAPALGQSRQKKRPKIKDFGSTLNNLVWDPNSNELIEIKQKQPARNSEDDDVVRIETNLVTCDILVADQKGNIVKGLTKEDFAVTEDGEPQQVGHFLLGDSASVPRTIVLIIDYSGSQLPYLHNSISAAKLLVDKLAPLDLMAIVTDDVELLIDFTNDKQKLKEKLDSLEKKVRKQESRSFWKRAFTRPPQRFGRSAQYSALMATLNEAFIEDDLRPIIVFQTDGDEIYNLKNPVVTVKVPPDLPDDLKEQAEKNMQIRAQAVRENGRLFSIADIYRKAEKSRATIYTVIPGYKFVGLPEEERVPLMKKATARRIEEFLTLAKPEEREQIIATNERWRYLSPINLAATAKEMTIVQTALAAVAPRTGGWTEFLETPEQAEGVYTRIMADISQRYIVGYYPTNKARDGKRRKIKFEVKGHPDYYILGRTSYYAPTP